MSNAHFLYRLPQQVVSLPDALVEDEDGISNPGAVRRCVVNELFGGVRVSDNMPLYNRREALGPLDVSRIQDRSQTRTHSRHIHFELLVTESHIIACKRKRFSENTIAVPPSHRREVDDPLDGFDVRNIADDDLVRLS